MIESTPSVEPAPALRELHARRIVDSERRGSSWPVLVETEDGLCFTKLHGAAQGFAPLVAEILVAELAEALGLHVPARCLVWLESGIEGASRDWELEDLVRGSDGLNLGFEYLHGARLLEPEQASQVASREAAAIVWLDALVMNPDRTARNPNLLWWRQGLWLIDHGAALGFQYAWGSVTEASPRQPPATEEPHVLAAIAGDLRTWDEGLAARLPRGVLEAAVGRVPDPFLLPLLPRGSSLPMPELLQRRRAAYVAFLWKRLRSPRPFLDPVQARSPLQKGRPSWVSKR